jgi:hypothetical protein
VCRFDLSAPHRLDGGQIGVGHRVIREPSRPRVTIPAAMNATWRSALLSTWPVGSGMRSDIAM